MLLFPVIGAAGSSASPSSSDHSGVVRTFTGGTLTPLSWLGFTLLVLGPLAVVGQDAVPFLRRDTSPYKGFSGVRVRGDSNRQVYFHEQTIAVIELGPGKQLLNCELIEVYKPLEAKSALQNLTSISKPIAISFQDMKMLMYQCHSLETTVGATVGTNLGRGADAVNPLTILSGILPGTKWCGTGDIARNYFDLGPDANLDKCCRSHDLCPVKVRAFQSRYNLTNYSIYTKSHCDCDTMLYHCLKATNNPTANLMGNLYFNLIKVPCVEDTVDASCGNADCIDRNFPGSQIPRKRRFQPAHLRY